MRRPRSRADGHGATPAGIAAQLPRDPAPPAGPGERFRGYALIGMAFESGDVLGLRRWFTSSVGPPYTSVWHRDPRGRWTFYADVQPDLACPRYAGAMVDRAEVAAIRTTWTGSHDLEVEIPSAGLQWRIRLAATPSTRLLSTVARRLPDRAWRSRRFLTAMGVGAGSLLRTGRLALHGRMPNGQGFRLRPQRIWMTSESRVRVRGEDFGAPDPRGPQYRIGDFLVPRRGVLAFGDIAFDSFDPTLHRLQVTRASRVPA